MSEMEREGDSVDLHRPEARPAERGDNPEGPAPGGASQGFTDPGAGGTRGGGAMAELREDDEDDAAA